MRYPPRPCPICGRAFTPTKKDGVYCSIRCSSRRPGHGARAAETLRARAVPLAVRFWERVCPEPNTGCWLWMGRVNQNGYGTCAVGSSSRLAHRVAYELARGPIPPGLSLLHSCIAMRSCVNPQHLRPGTHYDNAMDAKRQGRIPCGDMSGSRKHPERRARGERTKRTRMTEEQVRELRRLYVEEGLTGRELAARFCITGRGALKIATGERWGHVK